MFLTIKLSTHAKFEIELIICIKMDLALNTQQRLICHKNQPTNQSITTTLGLSEPGCSDNQGVLQILQNSRTGASPWDCLILYPAHLSGDQRPAEVQSVYSPAPADWAEIIETSLSRAKEHYTQSYLSLTREYRDNTQPSHGAQILHLTSPEHQVQSVISANLCVSMEIMLLEREYTSHPCTEQEYKKNRINGKWVKN